MTAEEHARFFAILQRQAASIVATPHVKGRASADTATSSEGEIQALLGPQRYAQYELRRKAWFAPAGEQALEVVP